MFLHNEMRKNVSRIAFLIQNFILDTLLPLVEVLEWTSFILKNQNAQRVQNLFSNI